jgi:hypothetical protein
MDGVRAHAHARVAFAQQLDRVLFDQSFSPLSPHTVFAAPHFLMPPPYIDRAERSKLQYIIRFDTRDR